MVNHKNSLTQNNVILIYFGMIPYTNHHSRVRSLSGSVAVIYPARNDPLGNASMCLFDDI